ncbi:threonine--tRNA ligase [Mobiluncus curtisii]|uniref:threonine--tRNA ligase n=1 Tax=Mobiluncus curtisii TaxID=2051 RepID=UPI0001E0A511|nr:threonine--tRNA ligase [Mobiluncus curtisii]EFL94459.1 threonine--tRNA ligase [Mobiluncus curtisii subsp. curtisii ATCC 35241]NMW89361.1 threonine--tRNA ligase [Mobiluncus curtisii]QQT13315.1 threonine--tRNA ligase [Mobiluncus curtisii]STY77032.1 Threonine--tRNA ligase [Mobiluncus curtisii subsp. curtisii]
MSEINVTIDGKATQIESTITGEDLYRDRKEVIAYFINGQARDLYRELHDGDTVEAITIDSEMGLNILRHSCTHVMAQAVKQVRPNVKYGIGPFIENGFYYDFGVDEPFTPEDLKAIEKYMARICKEDQKFVRRVVTEDEGRAELADQPYKLELIGLKGTDSDNDQAAAGASVEVGGNELTIYDNVRKNGEVAWKDLCRGPHVPSTRLLNGVFKLMKVSAAYWRGDQANDSLQRIYGTAWATKDDLKEYVTRMAEAAKRDHRRLGNELDLFSFPEEIGSGLAVFHPKGAMVRMEMENYSRRRHLEEGYSFVYTPHVTKGQLFETSGHLEWYKDGMFPPMRVDEECDDQGNVTKEGFDYYLKPMNCPMHNLIYKSRSRSYRELPLRLFEFGTVYRYEKSGVVHGLTRGRGFTQDDSHIYCTREQMKDELTKLLTFVLDLLKDYGLDDFYLELSTKNPHKFVGSDEIWEEATNTLAEVATASGLELVPDPEGAAFYGPKISVQARDAIGRTWQMSTIQLDFNLPERFDLEYTAADGSRQRPVMIHRALFGSIERFFGVLTEHYAGAFPAWLAPVQVRLVPVAEAFNDYCEDIANRLRAENVRVEVDTTDDRFGKKIRNAAKDKIPFTLIAGGEDAEANAVSFRYRGGEQKNGVPIDQAIAEILEVIRSRRND